MKHALFGSVVIALSVYVTTAFYGAHSALPIQGEQQHQPHRPPPPHGSPDRGEVILSSSFEALDANVTWNMVTQRVKLLWSYEAGGHAIMSYQDEAVPFWPTEVASFGANRLLVTGIDPQDGSTVIELWTFQMPQALPMPYMDHVTGEVTYSTPTFPVSSKRAAARLTGHGAIRVLWKLQGVENVALVQFWNERSLYRLNLADGSLTKILSPVPDGSIQVIPELAVAGGRRSSKHHQVEGYVYRVGSISGQALLLFDSDLDGTLDDISLLDNAEFHMRGLGYASQYVAFH